MKQLIYKAIFTYSNTVNLNLDPFGSRWLFSFLSAPQMPGSEEGPGDAGSVCMWASDMRYGNTYTRTI